MKDVLLRVEKNDIKGKLDPYCLWHGYIEYINFYTENTAKLLLPYTQAKTIRYKVCKHLALII